MPVKFRHWSTSIFELAVIRLVPNMETCDVIPGPVEGLLALWTPNRG